MKPIFGTAPPGSLVRPRRAAYAVIADDRGRIAAVKGRSKTDRCLWLPGGGGEARETVAETICREVAEELGHSVDLIEVLGEAEEVFHAESDGCWFRMEATFVSANLGHNFGALSEHEVLWLEPDDISGRFFHLSHAWAVQTFIDAGGA